MQFASLAPLKLSRRTRLALWIALAAALIGRVAAMIVMPLTDTSEARYGEIARKMAETGDWITPQIDYGVPFWAKPPLSTWLSAIDIKLFGASEFSVRLPSLLMSVAMVVLVWHWVAVRRGRDQALLTVTLLATSALFAATAGAVMTDASLALCTTLAMVAFWNAMQSRGALWGFVFFAALGVGLLAKGPLVGVLTLLPIGTWLFARGEWRRAWQQLPWISGSALMLLIAAPWYVLAELKTPGFLKYFIIGEHIQRFLTPGWDGDKYGNAHAEPIGMIWVFWLYAAFPFSALALVWIARRRRELTALLRDRARHFAGDGWNAYLLLWSVMHLCFFTAAGNTIWTYALTGLPAFACLAAELLGSECSSRRQSLHRITAACFLTPVVTITLALLYAGNSSSVKSSQRELVRTWMEQRTSPDSRLVYFLERYPSAAFYSKGKAEITRQNVVIDELLANQTLDFLAIKDRDLIWLAPEVRGRFRTLRHFDGTALMEEIPPGDTTASFP